MVENEEFGKVYESLSEGPNRGGKPLGRWKDWIEEYLGEKAINGRGVLELRRERGVGDID